MVHYSLSWLPNHVHNFPKTGPWRRNKNPYNLRCSVMWHLVVSSIRTDVHSVHNLKAAGYTSSHATMLAAVETSYRVHFTSVANTTCKYRCIFHGLSKRGSFIVHKAYIRPQHIPWQPPCSVQRKGETPALFTEENHDTHYSINRTHCSIPLAVQQHACHERSSNPPPHFWMASTYRIHLAGANITLGNMT
jgi:hypothetical protein